MSSYSTHKLKHSLLTDTANTRGRFGLACLSIEFTWLKVLSYVKYNIVNSFVANFNYSCTDESESIYWFQIQILHLKTFLSSTNMPIFPKKMRVQINSFPWHFGHKAVDWISPNLALEELTCHSNNQCFLSVRGKQFGHPLINFRTTIRNRELVANLHHYRVWSDNC